MARWLEGQPARESHLATGLAFGRRDHVCRRPDAGPAGDRTPINGTRALCCRGRVAWEKLPPCLDLAGRGQAGTFVFIMFTSAFSARAAPRSASLRAGSPADVDLLGPWPRRSRHLSQWPDRSCLPTAPPRVRCSSSRATRRPCADSKLDRAGNAWQPVRPWRQAVQSAREAADRVRGYRLGSAAGAQYHPRRASPCFCN